MTLANRRLTLPSILACTLFLFSSAALAGIHYQQTQLTVDEDKGKTLSEMKVESWVDGPQAKVLFVETMKNPMFEGGNYMLTQDGGKTVYLVNPKDETYMEWDIEAMLGMLGGIVDAMGGMMNVDFKDVRMEQIETKAGGSVAGIATQYRKFRTNYRLEMSIMGLKQGQEVETLQEIWGSPLTGHEALGVWLRDSPPTTGFAGLDDILKAEMKKIESVGFPLKTVSRTVTTQFGRKGNAKGTRIAVNTAEVTLWEQTDIPSGTFVLPEYKQVAMPDNLAGQTAGAEDDSAENGKKKRSLKGLFKRN